MQSSDLRQPARLLKLIRQWLEGVKLRISFISMSPRNPVTRKAFQSSDSLCSLLFRWGLSQYSPLFARAGYRQLFDLLSLTSEKDIRALGVTKDADVTRAMSLIQRLEQQHRELSLQMDAMYVPLDEEDIRAWLKKRELEKYVKIFEANKVRNAMCDLIA